MAGSDITVRNTGYVLTPTRQQDYWALITEADWIAWRHNPIRHFPARQELGAVLWAEAWAALKKLAEVPPGLDALLSESVVADQIYDVPPVYHLLVLVDRLDQRHRYLTREGRLPILLSGCETDEEAIQEAREMVERGHLDD